MLPKDKDRIVVEVVRRVLERPLDRAAHRSDAYIENIIGEVLWYESKRVETDRTSSTGREDKAWLGEIRDRMRQAGDAEKVTILEEIIRRHVQEILGHFSVPMYKLSTTVLPTLLGLTLNAMSPLKLLKSLPHLPDVSDHIEVRGDTETLRELKKHGTFIFVPTHSSNFDSVVIGYAIHKAGLPPVTYGAGLNLFHNPFLGFFMHRLGAYKVDRLKKHDLYKEVLKEYATTSIELGYDNLFFPGGTRNRSGSVERRLKLGLMGSGLRAFLNNLKNGKENPRVFVVPCTINYQLVLEASTLIEDHLKEAGKSRYIIEDDEFSRFDRLFAFTKNLVRLDARIFIHFGAPMDPFGNAVDAAGRSLDGAGRELDPAKYLLRNGKPAEDENRDVEFTRELGEKVGQTFMRDSYMSATHVAAWTAFEMFLKQRPDPDFYRFLRHSGREASLPMTDFYRGVARTLDRVRSLQRAERVMLSKTPATAEAEKVVDRALTLFGSYHIKPALIRRGDRLFTDDMNLLYYYRNRLWGYGLERGE